MYQSLTIVGNLGDDPEMRYTKSGKPVANFSVAVNNRQDQPPTWFRVTVWERLAETVTEYLKKGKKVLCVGTIEASAWTDRKGDARASLDMTAFQVKFLSPRDEPAVQTYDPSAQSEEEGTAPW